MITGLTEKISPPPKSGLYEVVWSLTNICDSRCLYCYSNSSSVEKNTKTVDIDAARRIISMMEELEARIVSFTGGDPLLNKNFFEIAEMCREKFKILFLSTNGHQINQNTAEKIKKIGIDSVQVSIDGPEELHDRLRGVKGSFKKALAGVKMLKEMGVDVAIAPTLTKGNIDQIEFLSDLAKNLDCDLSIKRVVLTGRGNDNDYLSITSDDYRRVYEYADDFNKKNKIRIFMHCDPLKFLLFDEGKKKKMENLNRIAGGCMAGSGILYINADGDIYPCSKLPVLCGNLNVNSLSEIYYNSLKLKEIRNRTNIKGKCSKCKYLNICGGCRATAFEKDGDYLDSDYLCWYN